MLWIAFLIKYLYYYQPIEIAHDVSGNNRKNYASSYTHNQSNLALCTEFHFSRMQTNICRSVPSSNKRLNNPVAGRLPCLLSFGQAEISAFRVCALPTAAKINIAVLVVFIIRPTTFNLPTRDHIYAAVLYSVTYDRLFLLFCCKVR